MTRTLGSARAGNSLLRLLFDHTRTGWLGRLASDNVVQCLSREPPLNRLARHGTRSVLSGTLGKKAHELF
eukprot:scaffold235852_cov28-Attheya_sp.AAC.1